MRGYTVNTIAKEAFFSCEDLKRIKFPVGVKEISICMNEQNVVSTRYAYDDGSKNPTYRSYQGFKGELAALGNGYHLIKVLYENGEEDDLRVNVRSCKGPVIFAENKLLFIGKLSWCCINCKKVNIMIRGLVRVFLVGKTRG